MNAHDPTTFIIPPPPPYETLLMIFKNQNKGILKKYTSLLDKKCIGFRSIVIAFTLKKLAVVHKQSNSSTWILYRAKWKFSSNYLNIIKKQLSGFLGELKHHVPSPKRQSSLLKKGGRSIYTFTVLFISNRKNLFLFYFLNHIFLIITVYDRCLSKIEHNKDHNKED